MTNTRLRLAAALTALAAAITSVFPTVFAEGSRELTANSSIDSYRPYFDWRDRIQLGKDLSEGAVESESVFYAYAQQGEKVYFGSNVETTNAKSVAAITAKGTPDEAQINAVSGWAGCTIAVTMPVSDKADEAYNPSGAVNQEYAVGSKISQAAAGSKTVYLFKPDISGTDKQGVIESLDEEKEGPNGVTQPGSSKATSSGYAPFSFTAPVTGTYSFRFLSEEYSTQEAYATPAPTPDTTDITKLPPDTKIVPPQTDGKEYSSNDKITDYIKCVGNSSEKISVSEKSSGLYRIVLSQTGSIASDGSASGQVLAVIPESNGTLTVSFCSNSTNPRTLTLNQYGKTEVGTSTGSSDTQTVQMEVYAGVPVYLYTNGSSISIFDLLLSDGTEPTAEPTATPTAAPTATPTAAPTATPTAEPTATPTAEPTATPTAAPALHWTFGTKTNGPVTANEDPSQSLTLSGCDFGYKKISDNDGTTYTDYAKLSASSAITYKPIRAGEIKVIYTANASSKQADVQISQDKSSSNGDTSSNTDDIKTVSLKVAADKEVTISIGSKAQTARVYAVIFTPSAAETASLLELPAQPTPTPTPRPNVYPLERTTNKIWADTPSEIGAWDITVTDAEGNVQNGRVWTDMLYLKALL